MERTIDIRYLARRGVAFAVVVAGLVPAGSAVAQPAATEAPPDGTDRGAANGDPQSDDAAASANAATPPVETDSPAASEAPPSLVTHLPINECDGRGARLTFDVAEPDRIAAIIVRYRPARGAGRDGGTGADGQPEEMRAARYAGSFEARLPAQAAAYPGFSYWVVARDQGREGERPIFASDQRPHFVAVVESEGERYEREGLHARAGHRAQASVRGEWVEIGDRPVTAPDGTRQRLGERYYRVEASYAHHFFSRVDRIRLGLGHLRGQSNRTAISVDGRPPPEPRSDELGLDYGEAEILFRILDHLRLRSAVLFGFSHAGFEVGGKLSMVLGDPDGTGLDAGFSAVTTLGRTAFVRLGWLTVPSVPMGATIEVTDFPDGDQVGVRMLYDVGYAFDPGTSIRVNAGYRGVSSTSGGPSLGAELAAAF